MEKVKTAHEEIAAIYSAPDPKIPSFDVNGDMTGFSIVQVGQAYQYFVGLQAFLLQKLATCDSVVCALEFERRLARDRLIMAHNGGSKKYAIDAIISQDPNYQEMSRRLLQEEATKTALTAAVKGVEARAASLSRELTRRADERQRV